MRETLDGKTFHVVMTVRASFKVTATDQADAERQALDKEQTDWDIKAEPVEVTDIYEY